MLLHNTIDVDLNLLIDIDDITSKELDKMNPMDIDYIPWLYERKKGFKNDLYFLSGRGKWLLFFDKQVMDQQWQKVKKLFRNDEFNGVEYIKCSTNYVSEKTPSNNLGVISFYCSDSSNVNKILTTGNNIINILNYTYMEYIYYKTDDQTKSGSRTTGSSFNYLYKIMNNLYTNDQFIDD